MADPSWAEIGKQLVQGSDVIVGASIGAVGAFIGGGLAALAAFLADRRRFKREDEAVRCEVYSEFVLSWSLYKEAERDLQQLAPGSPQKNEEAHRQLLRTFNALSLIAPEEVRAAADEVVKEVEGAPGRFWEVARKDVGISDWSLFTRVCGRQILTAVLIMVDPAADNQRGRTSPPRLRA